MIRARSLMIRAIALAIEGESDAALDTIHVAETAYSEAFGESHTQTLLCSLNEVTVLVAKHDYPMAKQKLLQITKLLEVKLPGQAPVMKQLASLGKSLANDVHRDSSRPPYFY